MYRSLCECLRLWLWCCLSPRRGASVVKQIKSRFASRVDQLKHGLLWFFITRTQRITSSTNSNHHHHHCPRRAPPHHGCRTSIVRSSCAARGEGRRVPAHGRQPSLNGLNESKGFHVIAPRKRGGSTRDSLLSLSSQAARVLAPLRFSPSARTSCRRLTRRQGTDSPARNTGGDLAHAHTRAHAAPHTPASLSLALRHLESPLPLAALVDLGRVGRRGPVPAVRAAHRTRLPVSSVASRAQRSAPKGVYKVQVRINSPQKVFGP